jgi:predicted hydrocarbon binding protein
MVDETQQLRRVLQATMGFMGALTSGTEQLLGGPANSMAYVAGKALGKGLAESARRSDDIEEALEELKQALVSNQCAWELEPFKRSSQESLIRINDDGSREVSLVFRDCMIRQALLCFGHEQKQSLCNMMYGLFSGALGEIMRREVVLEIDHCGPNACLKRLIVKAGNGKDQGS